MKKDARIYVAGHRGVAGYALCKLLSQKGYSNVVTKTHRELELCNEMQVKAFFEYYKPEYVFFCAGRAGGIVDKMSSPVDFFEENMKMQMNVMKYAQIEGVRKLLFMGSVYAYPADAAQPIREESLFTGAIGTPLDEPYALAKIAGVKMCEAYHQQYGCNFFSVMPCVFFGEKSTFDLKRASVVPAMIRRMAEAKKRGDPLFEIWGTGKPVREFMSGKDIARACLFLMENYNGSGCFNLGNGGTEISIAEVANTVKQVVGYEGRLTFNTDKPDGMMRKTMDSSKLFAMGWKPVDSFYKAVEETYAYYHELEEKNENNNS